MKIVIVIAFMMVVSFKVYAADSFEDQLGFSFEIPAKTQQLMGLQTQAVQEVAYGSKIGVAGRIAQDIEDVTEIFTPASGRLKECLVAVGSVVSKAQVICRIEKKDSTIIEIKAPQDGVVIADYSTIGEEVDTISPIHTIGNLSKLSAVFDVYEPDAAKIQMGQQVLVYANTHPDKTFKGVIKFISPRVDESSFTIKIRVEIDNKDLLLKPGMFVRGEILVASEKEVLKVPTAAVQNIQGVNLVFLQDEAESFTPTQIDIQSESKGQVLIVAALYKGDQIVTEGSYILKSKILEDEIAGGCSH